jgi:hypothetical protein
MMKNFSQDIKNAAFKAFKRDKKNWTKAYSKMLSTKK